MKNLQIELKFIRRNRAHIPLHNEPIDIKDTHELQENNYQSDGFRESQVQGVYSEIHVEETQVYDEPWENGNETKKEN